MFLSCKGKQDFEFTHLKMQNVNSDCNFCFNSEYLKLSDIVLKRLEQLIDCFCSGKYGYLLTDPIKYSLLNKNSKRLRPVLALLFCKILGVPIAEILDCACAIEMIHCYSLVHDDLPSMDNDDYRRGKLTIHKKFNESIAILTGNALLTMSFQVIANSSLDSDKKINIIDLISEKAGARGMVLGQAIDLQIKDGNNETILFAHERKTADLFIAAVCLPAMILNENKNLIIFLKKISSSFGCMFQAIDDIADLDRTENITDLESAKNRVLDLSKSSLKTFDELLLLLKKKNHICCPKGIVSLVQNILNSSNYQKQ